MLVDVFGLKKLIRKNNMKRLKDFGYNIESQWGEDGILEEIFKRIGEGNKTCIEFGAYNGPHLSNTWNLWFNKKWKALLIEGNPTRANKLKEYVSAHSQVKAVEAFVAISGENSIESIIDREWKDTSKIDVMSIDIDGDDYYILESLEKYKPRLIIIEYNPTIPPHLDIIQKPDQYFGSSALAITKLAEKKGYKLVEIVGTNCFFIQNEDYNKIYDREYSIYDFFPHEFLNYIINAFDGYSFLTRKPAYDSTKKNLPKPKLISEIKLIPVGNILPRPQTSIKVKSRRVARSIYYKIKKLFSKKQASSHDFKVRTIKSYAEQFKIKTFIETGTYLGDTISAVKHTFDTIYTIELNERFYRDACEKFKNYSHIQLVQGDSGKKLKEIVGKILTPSLFWLDGHYSGGETSKSDKKTPIIKELETIFSHKLKHVILIDDARYFTGKDDYPTLAEVKKLAQSHNYNFRLRQDIICLY